MSSRIGVCAGEGFQAEGTAQINSPGRKIHPSVPKDGTDIKFRSGGKAGQDRFTDLGSEQALS